MAKLFVISTPCPPPPPLERFLWPPRLILANLYFVMANWHNFDFSYLKVGKNHNKFHILNFYIYAVLSSLIQISIATKRENVYSKNCLHGGIFRILELPIDLKWQNVNILVNFVALKDQICKQRHKRLSSRILSF